MLKDWLVRRRENPYPSRDEKKMLAISTGLTYIQICNWFANWRRKLKNAGREPTKKTWGHLIKTYNVSANGNVEQFSICSEDSIWGDDDRPDEPMAMVVDQTPVGRYCDTNEINYRPANEIGAYFGNNMFVSDKQGKCPNHRTTGCAYYMTTGGQEQCFQISSTTYTHCTPSVRLSGDSSNSPDSESSTLPDARILYTSPPPKPSNAKYKSNIMQKYLRDIEPVPPIFVPDPNIVRQCSTPPLDQPESGLELSKWLESAANFTPKKNNYIEWERNKVNQDKPSSPTTGTVQYLLNHEREDLEAAEVLTSLAGNYRNRMFGFPPKACVANQP